MSQSVSPVEDIESPMLTSFISDISPDDNGLLNISGMAINRLSERQIRSFAHQVIAVDASSNKFTSLDFVKFLPRCHIVNGSKNQCKRLISLAPLKNVLEVLDMSENQIASTEHYLSQFMKLKVLNLSHNFLQTFPSINELVHLTFIDISFNDFSTIPNLKRLPNLLTLKMNSNEISTLKEAPNLLPITLKTFEIADNKIADLTEMCHLKQMYEMDHFSIANNPCVQKPYDTFNYRPFVVSKILSLSTVDDEEVSDDERLTAEYLHTHKKMPSFYPDANKHEALVKFLEKECSVDSSPLKKLTPSHPKIQAVREEYLHNKPDMVLTPIRTVQSADRNRRIISPTPKRSATFDASVPNMVPACFPETFDLKPLSNILGNSNESLTSNGTVVLTESESINLNFQLPVIENEEENIPQGDVADHEDEDHTYAGLEDQFDHDEADNEENTDVDEEFQPAPMTERAESPLLRPFLKTGWTNIVRESPFGSVIVDNEPLKINRDEESVAIDISEVSKDETKKTLDQTFTSTQLMEKLCELKKKDNNNHVWEQVMQALSAMNDEFQYLKNKIKVLEEAQNQQRPSTMDAIQMFMPMPSNIHIAKESTTSNYTLSWDTVPPVQPSIRGYAVYIDGKFHSEVKAPVVRVRGPLSKGQKITLEAISVTNIHSLPGEIIINQDNVEADKENDRYVHPAILTGRSV